MRDTVFHGVMTGVVLLGLALVLAGFRFGFRRLFRLGRQEADDPQEMPWDLHPSIYEHILAYTDESQPGLMRGGYDLPDELRYGALYHLPPLTEAEEKELAEHDRPVVRKTLDLISAWCKSPTSINKLAIYDHLRQGDAIRVVDEILDAICEAEGLDQQRLYELAYSFATEATDREPVQMGMAILGLFGLSENIELFHTLGRHEELTLYAVVALLKLRDDPERAVWELAQKVDGDQRGEVIDSLKGTERQEIKDWILRDGYEASSCHMDLAYYCATVGDLDGALQAETVDRALLSSAGEMLDELMRGQHGPGSFVYRHGAMMTERFLGHLEPVAERLEDLVSTHSIRHFLTRNDHPWEDLVQTGWTLERRARMVASCDRILSRPGWPELTREGLESQDENEFKRATWAARILKIDTWEAHWRRLQASPLDWGLWIPVVRQCNEARAPQVVDFARQVIDLDQVGTGPSDEGGLGEGWEHHQCLGMLFEVLRKWPDLAEERLILAALRSPVIRNRSGALMIMELRDRELWSEELHNALYAAVKIEPEEIVRLRMQRLINGEPRE